MFSIFAAAASVVADVSGAVLAQSVPVVGSLVVEGAKTVGTAVGSAVTSAGGSCFASEIASGAVRTAIHGAAIEAADEFSD